MTVPNGPTPLTYNGFVTQLALMAVAQVQTVGGVVQSTDANFQALIPQALNYAELRIQRDCQLLPLQTSADYAVTAGSNLFSIPASDFVTVQTIWVNVNGSLMPLTPVSKEWLQNVYPGMGVQGAPKYFATVGGDLATAGVTSTNILLGPVPDSAYPVEIFGMIRMPSLNNYSDNEADASTQVTFISQWMPDLLVAAAMIWTTGYQRDFGAMGQVDEAGMGVSWEGVYQGLLKGAQAEQGQERFQASAWSSMAIPVAATPDR